MKTRTVRIGGMTCVNCQNRIEKALRAAEGVAAARVSYGAETAEVTYDAGVISLDDIEDIIKKLGYEAGDSAVERKPASSASRTAGLVVIIIAAAALFDRFGAALFSAFPTAEAGMSLGMMFIIGLITSVHCAAMCGGINLSQTLGKGGVAQNASVLAGGALLPSFLYNGGRVISYTVIGGVVGAAGSVFSLSGKARGVVQIAAGVFMVIMGMNMLGVFPFLRALTPRLPRFLAAKLDSVKTRNNSPLVIGLLNGFMPCGPLQAMQLYALSTGSAAKGAASMLLFSLGTVPLMFGLGALGTFLSSRPAITLRVMTVGACVVAVMGISMFSQGAALSGLSLSALLPAQPSLAGGRDAPGGSTLKIVDGVQVVNSTLSPGRYPAITVQAGIPVKWTILAPEGSINGCNNRVIIPQYNIQHRFRPGENVIEFTPEETGKFRYSCWMGMIRSSITVVADSAALEAASAAVDPLAPVPAGYTIPADEMAIAEPGDYNGNKIQRVSLTLTDEGFRPAVAVVERGVPTEWVIDNRSIEDGSAELRVPLYTTILPLTKQALNPLYLQPESDFDFSTGDSIFFGYMKVVDDISDIDRESIQKEVAAFETQVYSDEYFETGAGGGCCGRGSGNY
ncbi:MAG: sulfite exporter TauE/SafE family protein [Treponematales bacterium]